MTRKERDKHVSGRILKDFSKMDSYKIRLFEFNRTLKDPKSNDHQRENARLSISLVEKHRKMLKEKIRQW